MISSRRCIPLCSLLVFIACALPIGEGCNSSSGASSSSSLPVFSIYWSVAVGDLNGDGRADIVASYTLAESQTSQPGFVAVYLQDPSNPGTFSRATYSVDNNPESVAVGDLNGDGRLDIVTANTTISSSVGAPNSVSVLLHDPTKPGQFLPATSYHAGDAPISVAVGDLNGDGKSDLAVADSSGISILLQNPNMPGAFLPRTAPGIGSWASSVAIADINGDNKADLIATAAASVVVLLQNPAVPGTFSPPTNYGVGLQPIYAVVSDLNGDGKPDLAVANLGSPSDGTTSSVSVLPPESGCFRCLSDGDELQGRFSLQRRGDC